MEVGRWVFVFGTVTIDCRSVEALDCKTFDMEKNPSMDFCLTFPHTERHGDHAVGPGHTIQAADEVWEVVQHWQVMFYNDDVFVSLQQGAYHQGGLQTLLDVQVAGWLVKHEAVMNRERLKMGS